MMDKFRGWI